MKSLHNNRSAHVYYTLKLIIWKKDKIDVWEIKLKLIILTTKKRKGEGNN